MKNNKIKKNILLSSFSLKKKNLIIIKIKKRKLNKLIFLKKKKLKIEEKNLKKKKIIQNFVSLSVFFLLVYYQFYRLSLILFLYILINNNKFIYNYYLEVLEDDKRFNKFYKKKFPILYYTLKPIILFSSFGIFYCLYSMNLTDYVEYIYQMSTNNEQVYLQEIKKFENYLLFFSSIFIPASILQILISIYVIKYANSPINNTFITAFRQAVLPSIATVSIVVGVGLLIF